MTLRSSTVDAGATTAAARAPLVRAGDLHDARYQAFLLMRLTFTAAPIAFGLDKFFNVLVEWPIVPGALDRRHRPRVRAGLHVRRRRVEIVAGLVVALKPRYGAYLVAAWLAGIIVNLLTYSGYYDVALRDFGLLLGALTLARLASAYDPPLRRHGRS